MKNQATIVISVLSASLILAAACGGSPPPVESAGDGESGEESARGGGGSGGMAVEGLSGTIPKEDVDRVFDNHMDGLLACYQDAVDDVEEIEGELTFALNVGLDGSVTEVFVRASDLGSVSTEKCMVRRISRFEFPRPGGGEVEVTYPLALEAPYDPPAPQAFGKSVVDGVLAERAADVERCAGGEGGVELTLWVGSGGVVLSAGAATESADLAERGHCLAEAARSWAFPDPGEDLARVEISF